MVKWTLQEIKILQENFEKVSVRELKKLLPNRYRECINAKGKALGLSRKQFDRHNYVLIYAYCREHGRLLQTQLVIHNGVWSCPYCWNRVRMLPRKSKREKPRQ